jgi:hypothetical protein
MAAVLLPIHLQDVLKRGGESGMGYQTGNVTLKTGKVVQDVVFTIPYVTGVRGHALGEVPFTADEIQSVELTHRRWKLEW